MSTGSRWLKRGDTFDPEDWRMTHRLGVARSILRSLQIEPTYLEHDEKCIRHPKNAWNRVHGFNYWCDSGCPRFNDPPPTWPEWVTDEIFELAFSLADRVQTSRGDWHQRQINEERRAREAKARAKRRLEELRVELREERISYGELAELQGLAEFIEEGDVELLEAAGVPEFPEDNQEEIDRSIARHEQEIFDNPDPHYGP